MNSSNSIKSPAWKDLPVWLRVIVVVGIVNFAACLGMDSYFGGSALNGYQKGNKFYIGSHGRYTQVTEEFWDFSYVHGISMYATHLSIFVGLALFLNSARYKIGRTEQFAAGNRP